MTKPSSMTELEAVNVLLTTIGEQPVNTLTGNLVTDVTVARQVLSEVSREVQAQGWHFNTEYGVSLSPNTNGEIVVPPDAARIDSKYFDVTVREGKLFNLKERTYKFNNSVDTDIVYFQDFESLPSPACSYITYRAARIYSDRMVNSSAMHQMILRDEQMAYITLKEFEGDVGDYNMMDNYSVARSLARGTNKRIL
jgi:hypothetical protein